MRFLSNPRSISSELTRLLGQYPRAQWAIAWAGAFFDEFSMLRRRARSIHRLVVGMHFYQTHPDFLAEFIGHDGVRVIKDMEGVFHPKLYLFEESGGRWECIVGSPNFTRGGFGRNREAAVLFSHRDSGAKAAHTAITRAMDEYWNAAEPIDADFVRRYRELWPKQQARGARLAGRYASSPQRQRRASKSLLDSRIFHLSWKEYVAAVANDRHHTIGGRLQVLEELGKSFDAHEHFYEIENEVRKRIAGFAPKGKIDWQWFGSMKGAGYFKKAIKTNSRQVSVALDEIPRAGLVGEAHYDRFARRYQAAFANSGLATGTRLLAMKRPDFFVCLDSKNKSKLCDEFGIPKQVGFRDYWGNVIARIQDSAWWQVPEPTDRFEKRVWQGRAALLDVLFYEPTRVSRP